jgi:hypothetical protein
VAVALRQLPRSYKRGSHFSKLRYLKKKGVTKFHGKFPPTTEMIFTLNLCQKISDLTTTKMKLKNTYFLVPSPQNILPVAHDTAWNKTAMCVFVKFQFVCY